MSTLRRWAPLPFVTVGIVATLILTSLHLTAVFVQTAQYQAQDGTGQDPAGTVAFFAVYLIPSALIEGVLIGLAAFAVTRSLTRRRRVPQRVISPFAGLAATIVALCLMVVPLIGAATGALLQLSAGVVALVSGGPRTGPANLIATIALALLLYVGAFTISSSRLPSAQVAESTGAR